MRSIDNFNIRAGIGMYVDISTYPGGRVLHNSVRLEEGKMYRIEVFEVEPVYEWQYAQSTGLDDNSWGLLPDFMTPEEANTKCPHGCILQMVNTRRERK